MGESEQLVLPIGVRPYREVYWINAEQQEKRRLFGKKIITRVMHEDGWITPGTTRISADTIHNLADPALRYALRFADAAQSVDWQASGPTLLLQAHDVFVMATDDGVESRFISAVYTGDSRGDNDSFMMNLRRCAPGYDEDH